MTIEQHAEAAADEIDRSMTDGPKAIIAKHMQSAIDEATASLKERIAQLEGMGPLIHDLVIASFMYGMAPQGRDFHESHRLEKARSQITAILKGGAS